MNLEYVGYWWLPSEPHDRIPGCIKISDENGINLELLGNFRTSNKSSFDISNYYTFILGITKEGKLVTLFRSRRINESLRVPGISTETYLVNLVFLEVHFTQVEELRFFKINVEYTHLAAWVHSGIPDFLKEYHQQYQINPFQIINADVNIPVLEANTTRGKISITPGKNFSLNFLDFNLRIRAYITIDLPSQELSLDECYFDYLYPWQNFLTLATNRNNYITGIELFSRHGTKQSIDYVFDEQIPIKLISNIISLKQQQPQISSQMLFSLKDIESEFSLYLQKWFNISNEIKHICNTYFGIKYADSMYGEQRFLSIVQVLESYHRQKISNKQNLGEEHKRRLNDIYKAVPSEHQEWLKVKLAFSHEPSLKERIEQLIEIHNKVITPLIKNQNLFTKKIINTRNYYTHYNLSLKDKSAQGEELFRLSQVLLFLLQSCLLNELGCMPDRCKDLISKDNEYLYLCSIKEVEKAKFEW